MANPDYTMASLKTRKKVGGCYTKNNNNNNSIRKRKPDSKPDDTAKSKRASKGNKKRTSKLQTKDSDEDPFYNETPFPSTSMWKNTQLERGMIIFS